MKTNSLKPIILALSLAAVSLPAMAFDTDEIKDDQTPLYAEFKDLDTSGDGLLDYNEASKDKLFTRNHFNRANGDADDTLDKDEFAKYKTTMQQKKAKVVVKDSFITTQAKADILATKGLKSRQISVETHQGVVLLSGFVDSQAAKDEAEAVVSKITGVKSVKNGLEVR